MRQLLKSNWTLLSSQERSIATSLAACGQGHLLKGWPRPGVAYALIGEPINQSAKSNGLPTKRRSNQALRTPLARRQGSPN